MAQQPDEKPSKRPPIGVILAADIEELADRKRSFRARVRWTDPVTGGRRSLSRSKPDYETAEAWITEMQRAAAGGVDPASATMPLAEYGTPLAEYGTLNLRLALRGLEAKTTEPYVAGWRVRIVPTLGHLPLTMITTGVVDRAVHGWIADGRGRSSVKNTVAMLVRIMEQAVRDGLIDATLRGSADGSVSTREPRTNWTTLARWHCPAGTC